MANYVITSGINSFTFEVDGKKAEFGSKELTPVDPDSPNILRIKDRTNTLTTVALIENEALKINLSVDTVDVNGVIVWPNAEALFLALVPVFFFVSVEAIPLIPATNRANTFAALPDPVVSDGEYWWVDTTTSSGIWPFRTTNSTGAYKAEAGAWVYKGADVPAYLVDEALLFTDDVTGNGLGFLLDSLTANRRATWQDKDIVVADNVDLLAEASTRQIVDEGTVSVHTDVDLTGVNLLDNTKLKYSVAANAFIACMHTVIRASSLVINNTNVFQDKINLAVSVQRLVVHKIVIDIQWSLNSAAQDFILVGSFGGQRIQNALTVDELQRQEAKDAAGGDPDGRGTNQKYSFTKTYYVTPTVLGANQMILQWAGSQNGLLASIWEASIEIEELVSVIGS